MELFDQKLTESADGEWEYYNDLGLNESSGTKGRIKRQVESGADGCQQSSSKSSGHHKEKICYVN